MSDQLLTEGTAAVRRRSSAGERRVERNMSKPACDHQVDANDVEPPAVTQTPTRGTAAERTRSKKTSPGTSEHIINASNNGSSEHKSAGEEADGKKKADQARRPGAKRKDNSKSVSSARSPSEDSAMTACPSPPGVSSLAQEQKEPLRSGPTERLRPGNGGSNIGEGLRRGTSNNEGFLRSAPRTKHTIRTTPAEINRQEIRRSPAPSFHGERAFLRGQNQARHAASLYSNSGAAEGIEHSSQRQVIRHGASTSFDAHIPLRGPTGGDAKTNGGNNNNPMLMTPCTFARPAAGSATEGVGSFRQAPHHHEPSKSFDADANINLQSTWYQVPPQTQDQLHDTVLRTPGAPGQRRPSPFLQQEQPWHQMPQSSKRMRNGSIDRSSGSIEGASVDRSLLTPERQHTPSEEGTKAPPTDKKRKRLPYRCKKCGQIKHRHECPLKHYEVETRGSQTSKLPPGTVIVANEVPVPAENGRNVFYARPYLERLHNHDKESGRFLHSTEAMAAPARREMRTPIAVGDRGHHWGPPEDSYSQRFPANSFHGVPPSMVTTTGNAVGVVDSPTLRSEMRTTGNAVGAVIPVAFGQDDRLVYRGSGGGGGGGWSAQQGEEPWQRSGFRGDGDRFGAANLGLLVPPPSVGQQWNGNSTDVTNITGMAGNSWSSSLGDSRRPDGRNSWQYPTEEEGEEERDDLDLSFRRFPWLNSALPSTRPIPTMPMPPPSPDVDRWRRDNPQVQLPSSVSIALPPRLRNLERIVFSEGFTRVSLGPPPTFEEEKEREEGKDAE